MNLLWPGSLILLALIPVIIAVYRWALRRRRRFAVRYASLDLVRAALPYQSRWRRHLPFALFLTALACLIVALGRPVTVTQVPTGQATVILAVDVSRSMLQNDIFPSRLDAAIDAAQSFIKRQSTHTQIGVVAFAGYAQLIQPPTNRREDLELMIASLTTGRGTAIGSGILESLDAIAEVNHNVLPSTGGRFGESQPDPVTPVAPGAFVPDIIVLLTDGVTTTGPHPQDAAQQAVDRGVRVFTIGFGTDRGGSFGQGGSMFGGGRFRRGIDEEALKDIADMTGGEYYSARSAGELQKVFESLPSYLSTREEKTEISVAFAGLGALLATLAMALSLLWRPFP